MFALTVLVFLVVSGGASPQKASGRRYIKFPGPAGELPFSDAVQVGNTLYLAGRIGLDPATGRPPDDLDKEIRNVLEGMKRTLAEAGMTMDDLVYVQVFCPDLSLYGKFNAVYRSYFQGNFPARAFVGSGPLLFGGHFEVQAIAVKE